ncbi:hypothetical protein ACOVAE_003057 [Listeria monocytogenes]
MKTTTVSYCQVCQKDFKNNEVVYYISIDNNIVCGDCANKANTKDIQPRIHESD